MNVWRLVKVFLFTVLTVKIMNVLQKKINTSILQTNFNFFFAWPSKYATHVFVFVLLKFIKIKSSLSNSLNKN